MLLYMHLILKEIYESRHSHRHTTMLQLRNRLLIVQRFRFMFARICYSIDPERGRHIRRVAMPILPIVNPELFTIAWFFLMICIHIGY